MTTTLNEETVPAAVPADPQGAFFKPEDIAKAILTPEQEAAVRDRNWCWKCASAMVVDVHRAAGVRWMLCKHCKTVYALATSAPPPADSYATAPQVLRDAYQQFVRTLPPGLSRAESEWRHFTAGATSAPPPVEAREPVWVLLARPGKSAQRKGPFYDGKLVEQMLRELYTLYPDATCLVINAPRTAHPEDGREWVSMFGDQRRKRIPRAATHPKEPTDHG